MTLTQSLPALFSSIDAKQADTFVSFLTEDAVFRYGSAAPAEGRETIRHAVAQFFSTITSCAHRILRVWEQPDTLVVQGEVRYVTLDGREVTVPFCNVFELRDEKIAKYLIYLDPTPMLAP